MQEDFLQLLVFFSFFRTTGGNLRPQIVSWIGFLQSFIFMEKYSGCTDFLAKAWINRY